MRIGAESNVVEVPVSWALDDYPHFEFVRMADAVMPGLKPPQELFDRWTDELQYMVRDFENGVVIYLSPSGHRARTQDARDGGVAG